VIKITIATPAYGDIFYTPYVHSMFKLTRHCQKQGWEFAFNAISYSEISESRNFLLTRWFDKSDSSHILFVDADMGFPAELISEMIAVDQPVVGVVYPKRAIDINKVAELAHAGDDPLRAINKAQDFVLRPLRGTGSGKAHPGFIEVEACGSGILLIQRACIEEMLKELPQVSDDKAKTASPLAKDLDRLIRAFDELFVDGLRLSEDFSFCHRWRHGSKGQVWANITHEITHIGLQQFRGSYADRLSGSGLVVIKRGEGTVVTGRLAARPRPKNSPPVKQ
jgi:hypothetical protein